MWICFEILCRGLGHIKVRQTVPNAEGYDVTIKRNDALLSTGDLQGLIIYQVPKMLHLTGRVYGSPLSGVGVLMKQHNNGTKVGGYQTCACADWKVLNLVVIDPSDIACAVRPFYKYSIGAGNASIGAAIN